MLIEIHCIQSVPASHLNSDRNGQPKTVLYGGVLRARISSQTQKRSARLFIHEHGLLDVLDFAYRSRRFTQLVAEQLEKLGIQPTETLNLAIRSMAALKLGHKEKVNEDDPVLNEFLIFFSESELQAFSNAIYEHRSVISSINMDVHKEPDAINASDGEVKKQKSTKLTKAEIKSVIKKEFPPEVIKALQRPFIETRSLEVNLLGRQLTNFPDGTVDGQVQVAHAFSMDESRTTQDFFTSVDDYAFKGMTKAGMLEEVGFNAPTLYRVAAINVSQLAEASGNLAAAKRGAAAFVEAFVSTLAHGGQNSFLSLTVPSFVLIQIVETGHALSYAPAFLKPVQSSKEFSTVEAAVNQLSRYIEYQEAAFPRFKRSHKVFFSETAQDLKGAKRVTGIDQAIKFILSKIEDKK